MAKKKYSKYFILYFTSLIITTIFIIAFLIFTSIYKFNIKDNSNMEHNENTDIVDIDNIQEYS